MKAITIHQPWASLLITGAKRYETRCWVTRYRGELAIHAGRRKTPGLHEKDIQVVLRGLGITATDPHMSKKVLDALPRGAIIAVATLVDCHEMYIRADGAICIAPQGVETVITGDERAFGLWRPGCYAWELADIQMLSVPCPALGQQRLWNWNV